MPNSSGTDKIMCPFKFPEVINPANIRRYVPFFRIGSYDKSSETTTPTTASSPPDDVFHTPKPHQPRSVRNLFDPYQIFEVEHRPCLIFEVKVVCGRKITKGWSDLVDTPDPYIHLVIRTAPEGRKKTEAKDNEVNPVWNEEFTFLLDDTFENVMEINLMEANYMYDEIIGTEEFHINNLPRNTLVKKTFIFNDVSEIDIEMKLSLDQNPTLRYSLCLPDQEKDFIIKRKEKVMEGLKQLLGDQGPRNLDEVPTVAVLGSGGGFRAMVGFSGVANALHDSGILQCATYVCGLSGSSWYISTLYSHDDFPKKAPSCIQEEMKNNIDSSLLWLLQPKGVFRYMDRIMKKRTLGQPVSFTDFFGHMVGETLLKGRLNCTLSEQQRKLEDGGIPMPLLTCVHVKKDRSARSFQEWVEFSPYEIGLAKYGAFMPTELFGSKFFMGRLCKKFDEPPLHFLQGIWGSAFCILFKRLLDDNRKLDPVEMIRQEMAKQLEENEQDVSSDSSDEGEMDEGEPRAGDKSPPTPEQGSAFSFSREAQARLGYKPAAGRGRFTPQMAQRNDKPNHEQSDKPNHEQSNGKANGLPRKMTPKRLISTRRTKQKGYWSNFLTGVFENKNFALLNSRAGRAGVIHNFMRGLSLQQSYPFSPFTPLKTEPSVDEDLSPNSAANKETNRASDNFDGIFEMHPTNVKHLYMVDAGLTFNSPYPIVLRPQREVDVILSFDFSARPSDSTPPFKELLLAAQWAKKHKVSFPPIDTTVFDREGMKELYIFKDPNDSHCPVVLHFCLVNIEFRKFSKPGVRRRTKEDKDFADFDMFDDPQTPYSTFNFKYSHDQFDRLAKLTEFNTLLNVDKVKEVFVDLIEQKRKTPAKCPCSLDEIPKLRRVSQKNKNRLSRFLSRMRSGRYSASDARKDIDKSDSTIIEENDVNDLTDGTNQLSVKPKMSRQRAITKKSPQPLRKLDSSSTDTSSVSDSGFQTPPASLPERQKTQVLRDQPGRRKPRQPENGILWQDSKCNSIDEDDDDSTFFTAIES